MQKDQLEAIMNELERSLTNFLSQKRDVEKKITGGIARLKSLRLKLEVENAKSSTVKVQIGMFEACFNPSTGLKERGNCFGLEWYIRDWLMGQTIKSTFDMMIQEILKAK